MWRSLLFIPTLEDRFVAKAANRGADAIILDLEASIAPDRKDEARAALPQLIERLAAQTTVTVRINPLWIAAVRDLEAAVVPGVSAVHMALCESAEQVRAVDGLISDLETQRSLPRGAIKLVPMIESADALNKAADIAKASPRVIGLTLGVEDYATSMGVYAAPELLRPAVFHLNQAARSADVSSFAVPASIADFKDTELLEREASYARKLGTVGGYAVHPAQVAMLNSVFSATADEIDWAEEVVSAAKLALSEGRAVFKVRGQMIDQPLITRAERILSKLNGS